jgi:hypothetical protein
MPRKLVKHPSGYACEGISREDWLAHRWGTEGGRPALNVAARSNGLGARMEHKTEAPGSCVYLHSTLLDGCIVCYCLTSQTQTSGSSAFECGLEPATFQSFSLRLVLHHCPSCSEASSFLDWAPTSFLALISTDCHGGTIQPLIR